MPPSINIPKLLDPRIQPNKLTRNGRVVSTAVEAQARRAANQIRAYEGRELFSSGSCLPAIGNTGGTRTRWRFRSKTSALSSRVRVVMWLARQTQSDAGAPDPRVTFELTDSAGSGIGTVTHHYGLGITTEPDDTPDEFAVVTGHVDVPGGTEIRGRFIEFDRGRVVAAVVYDEGPSPTKANGYLLGTPAQGSNIYSEDREDLVAIVNVWPEVGSHVWNFQANDDGSAYQVTGTTGKNIIDQTSTTVSAATPGFFFDGTGKALARQSGVPCKVWVYGEASDEGYVDIKDDAGTTLETVVIASLAWYSTTVTLPASNAKYDLHAFASSASDTVDVHAVSIYEDG